MKLREGPPDPWRVRISQIFEAAFFKRGANIDAFGELLDSLEFALRVDPRICGEPHPSSNGRFWVYEPPPIKRLPRVFILYEIDEAAGVVTLWNFCLR